MSKQTPLNSNAATKLNICYIKKVKVKWSRYRPGVAQRVGRGIALLFHDCGTRRGWAVNSTPRPHFTPGRADTHFTRGWMGPRAGLDGQKISPPPRGLDLRLSSLVSRYTNWATWPTNICYTHNFNDYSTFVRSWVMTRMLAPLRPIMYLWIQFGASTVAVWTLCAFSYTMFSATNSQTHNNIKVYICHGKLL